MSKLEELEKEIEKLSRSEFASFRTWFLDFDVATWDRQIEMDAAKGKLDRLACEALAAHERGESREI